MSTAATALLARLVLLACVAVAPLGCAAQARPSHQPAGSITEVRSRDWARLTGPGIPNGCALVNNTWNRANAAAGPARQELYREKLDGHAAFGWSWQWPASPDVVAYPEIVCGCKPWDAHDGCPRGGPFPVRVGTKTISVEFDIRLQATGQYNMAFSMWGVADPAAPRTSITYEIMIWITADGIAGPGGAHHGDATIGAATFDVYVQPGQYDHSGGSEDTWTYVAFVARQPLLHGRLDLTAFVDYLRREGILIDRTHIADVELGNEVSAGTGLAEIADFRLTVGQAVRQTAEAKPNSRTRRGATEVLPAPGPSRRQGARHRPASAAVNGLADAAGVSIAA